MVDLNYHQIWKLLSKFVVLIAIVDSTYSIFLQEGKGTKKFSGEALVAMQICIFTTEYCT
jgi:hypothetical protein